MGYFGILPQDKATRYQEATFSPNSFSSQYNQRWRSYIQLVKTRAGAHCDSAHKFLIAKFRLNLKKIRKTSKPFRYDLSQIPYDYTVEMTNSWD